MAYVKRMIMAAAFLAALLALSGCGSKDVIGDDSNDGKGRNELTK